MEEAVEAESEAESKDYLARCNCGDCDESYINESIISWELTDLPPFEFDNY